jgi:DNA invertase Pin-like site-specific DNA recombinase
MYAADTATASWLEFELAVLQNEHRGARASSTRKRIPLDSIYRDPVYGAVKRAQDRQARADDALAEALYEAHAVHGQSIRKVALNAGMKKSQVHEIIKRERERREHITTRPATVATPTASDWDDIPF